MTRGFRLAENDLPEEQILIRNTQERQKRVLKTLPGYFKFCLILAIIGFLTTTAIQYFQNTVPKEYIELITFKNISLSSTIKLLLTFFSILVMWLFVIWSMTFIPYIAYRAQKVSQEIPLPLGSKSFRWLRLYASSCLPIIMFAIVWSSFATKSASFMITITNWQEFIFIIAGGLITWGALWLVIRFIPLKLVATHIAILSTLLFTSIFLAYGSGFSQVSYSTLFGILFLLTFSFDEIGEIGRRLSVYDLDVEIAENINSTSRKENELKVKEVEIGVRRLKTKQDSRLIKLGEEENINKQLSKIQKTKMDFNARVNETTLDTFNKQSSLLKSMYEILSTELSKKMQEEIPEKINRVHNNAKNLTPEQLRIEMKAIYQEMEASLNGIPESLEDLRNQMDKTVKKIKSQTLSITESSEEE